MVMHVSVEEAVKGPVSPNEIVHVELPLAGQPLNDYASALPVGTEVVLYLEPALAESSDFVVGNENFGRPPGSSLWRPGPQGFIVGTDQGVVLPLTHAIKPTQTLEERIPR
jgi:hypothetical protein